MQRHGQQQNCVRPSTVVTVLPLEARSTFDLATGHFVRPVHVSTVGEAIAYAHDHEVSATVLYARTIAATDEQLVRGLAAGGRHGVSMIFTDEEFVESTLLLRLGGYGLRHVVNVRGREGWSLLRTFLTDATTEPAPAIRRSIGQAVCDLPHDAGRFFDALIWLAPRVQTAKALSAQFGFCASTMSSRFLRIGLPSPKRYLAETRLLFAAAMLEDSFASVACVAARLRYSSPQSFARHVRRTLGLTVSAFRYRYSGMRMIPRYIAQLIEPHRERMVLLGGLFVTTSEGGDQNSNRYLH